MRPYTRASAASMVALSCVFWMATDAHALRIGVDNSHGFDALEILGSGAQFTTFRNSITGAGHTIVPLTSFSPADLATVDAVILKNNYSQNAAPYGAGQMNAIRSFASVAVFVSDSTIFGDAGPGLDTPITFGDNQKLLNNIVGYIAANHGVCFLGDDGTGFDFTNMNALVAPYGIQYAASPTDASGRTVTGILPHTITSGVSTLGVDFQLPMTINAPALDLTSGVGQDNILAVVVPEPGCAVLLAVLPGCFLSRRATHHRNP